MGENKYLIKARKEYSKKSYGDAIQHYNTAIKQLPTDPNIMAERAMAFYHLGNMDSCLADMNSAQNLQPNNPYRYSSRAYVKNRVGDIDGAIVDYQKAVHLDPEDAVAYNNLGLAMESKGYAEKAKSNFKKADELVLNSNSEPNYIKTDEPIEKDSAIKYAFNNVTKSHFLKEFLLFVKNGFKLTK